VVLSFLLVACAPAVAPVEAPVAEAPAVEAPAAPAVVAPAGPETPYAELWAGSGHAKVDSEAFRHWDKSDPAEVPAGCVKCHAGQGLAEFLASGKNEAVVKAADDQGITCVSCHNDASLSYTSVVFPSGATVSDLGREAICMTCHQGRESKVSVDKQITDFAVEDMDAVVAPMSKDGKDVNFGFRNVHYAAAAATQYGTLVKGGYEFDGKTYEGKFTHIDGYSTCTDCHNSHSLEVKVEKCAFCHENVKTTEDTKNIRMVSSSKDYDGDGDVTEGIAGEISTLQEKLLAQLGVYAKEKAGVGIAYDAATYPYWFADADGDGKADMKDDKPVAFTAWTANLLKAAYNYQYSIKDAGAFVHNGKYIIELLIDSTEVLGGDVTKFTREDSGHFDGASMAFRDWDGEGEVPYNCSKCHSATGLPEFIKNGGTVAVTGSGSTYQTGNGAHELSSGFTCYTCHDDSKWPALYEVAAVAFPNGKSLGLAVDADGKNVADPNNICLECHQGRQSGVTVASSVRGKDADTADKAVRFQNVHYLSAGATLFGSAAQGMYQYADKEYFGQNMHVPGFTTCTTCHEAHTGEVQVAACKGCHGTDDMTKIRKPGDTVDYDGDGDTAEGYEGEIATLKEKLYAALQEYAKTKLSSGVMYDPAAYPYWYADVDGDGKGDKDADGKNVAIVWSPRLAEAAYNLNYATKEAGVSAHNPFYVMQVLYDTIQDLGGDVAGMTRP